MTYYSSALAANDCLTFETAADTKAMNLLIERIDIKKTEYNISSTLSSVLGIEDCGGLQYPAFTIRIALPVRAA